MNLKNVQELLKKYNQEHLLEYYDELNEQQRKQLLDDISKVNFSVLQHLNAQQEESKEYNISPIPAKSLDDIKANREQYLNEGLSLLRSNKVAAVLLAGGQGTRLGSDKPKGMYDIGETRHLSIFEQLMNNVKDVTSLSGEYFHLFVMTSDINNADTVKFFKDNNYFGYPENKIHFFIQDAEPVCSTDGKIYLNEKHRVAFSPNGNGGWYVSLISNGYGRLLKEEGIEWLNVFAVDNVLQRICDPVFIGATSLSRSFCGAKVVRKACPEERVGVLCTQDGRPGIVEYYEIPYELAALRNEKGELVYPYGVILNYLFNVHVLDAIISWQLPYHIAKKAVPHIENGVLVHPTETCGCKFELLVLDMIKYMGSCLAYEVVREKEFAPIKNKTGVDSVESARALLKQNGVKL